MSVRHEYPTAKELTEALDGNADGHGKWDSLKRTGKACCPAHTDESPSLDIKESGGKVLFVCRAGCSNEAVLAALRRRGLWPDPKPKATAYSTQHSRIVATYDYLDENGVLRFQAVRYEPKTFKQRRPDGKGGWVWNLPLDPLHRFLPYKLPELTEAIACDRPVFIVEGEKDVENGAAKLGIIATCNAGGAGKWRPEHAAYLKGADATIIPDNDDAGRNHSEDVAASLNGIAKRIRILTLPDLPPKGDLSDWIAAGGTADQLWTLLACAPEWEPNRAERRAFTSAIRKLRSRKGSEIKPEQIVWIWRGRIAKGKHTALAGEPGVGKSTLLYWIAATITRGSLWPCSEGTAPKGSVVLLSAEDGPADTIVPRFLAAGGDPDKLHIITAVETEEGVGAFSLQADLHALEEKVREIGDVVLIIIDPISSYMGAADGHSNTDVRSVLEPLNEMADRLGVAILSNSHFSKAGAANKSRASHRVIGSTAFTALPRAVFSVVQDAEDDGRKLLLHLKNNIAPAAKGLAYRLAETVATYIGDPPAPLYATRVEWESEHVATTADQAIAQHEAALREAGKRPQTEAQCEAEEFLREQLDDGAKSKKDIEQQARAFGISSKVLRTVRERICNAVKETDDKGRVVGSMWSLKIEDATRD